MKVSLPPMSALDRFSSAEGLAAARAEAAALAAVEEEAAGGSFGGSGSRRPSDVRQRVESPSQGDPASDSPSVESDSAGVHLLLSNTPSNILNSLDLETLCACFCK